MEVALFPGFTPQVSKVWVPWKQTLIVWADSLSVLTVHSHGCSLVESHQFINISQPMEEWNYSPRRLID